MTKDTRLIGQAQHANNWAAGWEVGGGSQPIILVKISSEQTHNGGGEVSSDITPSRPVMLKYQNFDSWFEDF